MDIKKCILKLFFLRLVARKKHDPVPNYKSKSVMGKSKSKYFSFSSTGQVLKKVLQIWRVLAKTWVTLASWFPSQHQIFRKFRVKILNSKKFRNVPRFWHYFLGTLSGCYKMMPGEYQIVY